MTPRGKRAALTLLGIAIAASVVLAYEARGHLQESWWMWRLRSADLESRNEAAQKLADRKCVRAIPEMLRLIAADSKEGNGDRHSRKASYDAEEKERGVSSSRSGWVAR